MLGLGLYYKMPSRELVCKRSVSIEGVVHKTKGTQRV